MTGLQIRVPDSPITWMESVSVRFGLVWFGLVWFGLVWFGLVWFGLVWFGLVWFGLVWFGLVWFGVFVEQLSTQIAHLSSSS
jgi:hypothetical protein